MAYKKISTSIILESSIGNVEINKFRKTGTNRIFWTPEIEGKRITKTMFARMSQAKKVGKQYIAWKKEQNDN